MKMRVSQSADGQGVLSLDGGPANRKRDRSGDRGGGGYMNKKGKFFD